MCRLEQRTKSIITPAIYTKTSTVQISLTGLHEILPLLGFFIINLSINSSRTISIVDVLSLLSIIVVCKSFFALPRYNINYWHSVLRWISRLFPMNLYQLSVADWGTSARIAFFFAGPV